MTISGISEFAEKFAEKGGGLLGDLERALKIWLSASGMTRDELLEYKTAEKFFVEHEPEGRRLMCVINGEKEQVGCGLHRESSESSWFLFMYIGTLLDYENGFKTKFGDEILRTVRKRG